MKGAPSIGAMRHQVVIQKTTQNTGADGHVTDAWSTHVTVWAEVVPLSGSETYVAQGITASVVYRISCRYVSGVVPKMRVLWGSRVFEIGSVRNLDERNRFLVMNCQELDV
jgi:SPP1 family predicted phage head-tail adaptor